MELLWPLLTAFLITVLSLPLTIKIANKYGLVDDPATRPHPAHVHQHTIPRAGGLSIYLGIVGSILYFVPIESHVMGIIASLTILLIMGLLDDKLKNFSPYLRMIIQFIAAAIVVGSGVGVIFVTNPFGGILHLDQFIIPFEFFGPHSIIVIADLLALIWIVALMNIINWSKGVDGQMPGIVTVAALTIAIIAIKLGIQGDINQINLAIIALITAASAVGFLCFNWHPAKILPGFSGSTILGFMIAVLSILSSAKFATAALVLLIPITDAIYTAWRRILTGHSPVWADRGHLHHKLLDLGWSHRQISVFYIVTGIFMGILAINLDSLGKLLTAAIIGTISLGVIGLLPWFIKYRLGKKSN